MRIRPLSTPDLDAALALWARTEHLAPVPRAEVEQLCAHDGELVLVAEVDGEVVGAVLGSFDGRRGWINRLAIDPAARRRGVGRSMVAELERRLLARGCRQVNLLVYADNDVGRTMWGELGYTEVPDAVLCSRRLDGAARVADRPTC